MKKIACLILEIMILSGIYAQSPIDKIFDKYSGKDGYTSVNISKYMFEMFKNVETEDDEEEFQNVLSRLNGIKILVSENGQSGFLDEINREISKVNYKELMVIKEENENIKFLLREKEDMIAELLMIVDSKDEKVIISIQGLFNMRDLQKIAKTMDIEGLDKLELSK